MTTPEREERPYEEGEPEDLTSLRALLGRRRARAVAFLALYEVDVARHDPAFALEWLRREVPLAPEGWAFVGRLVEGVLAHREDLDRTIQAYAPLWPVHLLSPVDRNLLRMALYELLHERETPPRVVINEAVELAKAFGSDSTPRFVNGVLGSVMDRLASENSALEPAAGGESNAHHL